MIKFHKLGYKPYNYGHVIYPLMTGTYWNNISRFAMNSGQKLSPVFVRYQQQMWGYEQIYYCRSYVILFIIYYMKLHYTYYIILYYIILYYTYYIIRIILIIIYVLYCIILYYIILYCIILYYTYYIVFYYIILYSILYYIVYYII